MLYKINVYVHPCQNKTNDRMQQSLRAPNRALYLLPHQWEQKNALARQQYIDLEAQSSTLAPLTVILTDSGTLPFLMQFLLIQNRIANVWMPSFADL